MAVSFPLPPHWDLHLSLGSELGVLHENTTTVTVYTPHPTDVFTEKWTSEAPALTTSRISSWSSILMLEDGSVVLHSWGKETVLLEPPAVTQAPVPAAEVEAPAPPPSVVLEAPPEPSGSSEASAGPGMVVLVPPGSVGMRELGRWACPGLCLVAASAKYVVYRNQSGDLHVHDASHHGTRLFSLKPLELEPADDSPRQEPPSPPAESSDWGTPTQVCISPGSGYILVGDQARGRLALFSPADGGEILWQRHWSNAYCLRLGPVAAAATCLYAVGGPVRVHVADVASGQDLTAVDASKLALVEGEAITGVWAGDGGSVALAVSKLGVRRLVVHNGLGGSDWCNCSLS